MMERHLAPRKRRRGAVLRLQSQHDFACISSLVAVRFRVSIPAILIRSPFRAGTCRCRSAGNVARIITIRCAGGRRHRCRSNKDEDCKSTNHGHDYRAALGRLSSVIRTMPGLLHVDCRPERTSLAAGLAGSAGPATASPTFFPGSVPSPSSRGKKPGFGRPPPCCGPTGAGPSSTRLIDRLSRPHRAASHN